MTFVLTNTVKYPSSKFVNGLITVTMKDTNGNTVDTGVYTFVKWKLTTTESSYNMRLLII